MARPLTDLLLVHQDLADGFFHHQEALLDRDFAAAAKHLDQYADMLTAHIRVEEEVVVPVFETLQPTLEALRIDFARGAAELYLTEHRKITDRLSTLGEQLARLQAASPEPRELIALLDRESHFKHMLEHHDLREREYLYPLLDEHLSEHERTDLWRRIDAHEAAAAACTDRAPIPPRR